ncbi:MAG: DUF2953 domain-containing protein [Firmicutes bacterium]|nr:DUF2953 domain-containing protein [Bacillota bacterium]
MQVEGDGMVAFILGFSLVLFILRVTNLLVTVTYTQLESCLCAGFRWGSSKRFITTPLYGFKPLRSKSDADLSNKRWNYFLKLLRPKVRPFIWNLIPKISAEIKGILIFGTGDAATTGFITGIIWQLVGGAEIVFKRSLKKGIFEFTVRPDFDSPALDLNIRCIVLISLLHIITAMMKTIWQRDCSIFGQGGRKLWRNIRFKA